MITEHAEWLPIRPTTDAALVGGIAHTLITEQLLDEALVNRYCVGYDESTLPADAAPNASYKDYVLGTGDDGIAKTPEWAADITGIPATRIRQLAREIASARACYICQGWGPQRHANGEQTRACYSDAASVNRPRAGGPAPIMATGLTVRRMACHCCLSVRIRSQPLFLAICGRTPFSIRRK